MRVPESLMNSLIKVQGFDKQSFEEVHNSVDQVTSIRLNPKKKFDIQNSHWKVAKVPWSSFGYYLEQRPSFTFDPRFHAGCYYVQEASSMFLEQALKQTSDLSKPIKILDLAAAPGGKSTHIQSLISKESVLVSNEVIRARVNILKDNIIKWGSENVIVTNSDAREFARLENFFDVVVVDAPCSGSGLFRRVPESVKEWSVNNVELCCQRQQRILADVWPSLKRGGRLIYSTCSYSSEENEDILDWMVNDLQAESVQLSIPGEWNIEEVKTDNHSFGYRFWPYKLKGEGFFIAVVIKTNGENALFPKTKMKIDILNSRDQESVRAWVKPTDHPLVKTGKTVNIVSESLINVMSILAKKLGTVYFGTEIGELVREKLIPAHALAMSNLVSDDIERIELSFEEAITYLKKQELKIKPAQGRGWQLVTYMQNSLGWINVLSNRINNYYPRELRILKDI